MNEQEMDHVEGLFYGVKEVLINNPGLSIPPLWGTKWIGPINEPPEWRKHMFFYPRKVDYWQRHALKYFLRINDDKRIIGIGLACMINSGDFVNLDLNPRALIRDFILNTSIPGIITRNYHNKADEYILEKVVPYDPGLSAQVLAADLIKIIKATKDPIDTII